VAKARVAIAKNFQNVLQKYQDVLQVRILKIGFLDVKCSHLSRRWIKYLLLPKPIIVSWKETKNDQTIGRRT